MSAASFEQQLATFIRREKLWEEEDRLLLAVSGGCDSVVMLHALHRMGLTLAVAHCNFRLRGEESDGDQDFVEELCRSLQIPCHCHQFDTRSLSVQEGISIQMAARRQRYEWFSQLLHTHGYHRLCTAHHADDQAETMLLNLITGRGMRALAGIPLRRQEIVRPLLVFTRAELEEWAHLQNLTWRHDRSNDESDYLRNLIRLQVIPVLKRINPAFAMQAPMLAREQSETCLLADEELSRLTEGITENRGDLLIIHDAALRSHPALFSVYRHLLRPYGFSAALTEAFINSPAKTGRLFLTPSHRLTCDRGQLIIESRGTEVMAEGCPIPQPEMSLDVPGASFRFHLHKAGSIQYKTHQADTAFIDAERLKFPLLLRRWEHGDRFMPLGMDQFRKLSDYFTDRKISGPEKKRIWILTSEDQIVWIAGERIDQRYRVTEKTEKVLEVNLHIHND
jgi:tRNA(Ile)-lysidine synthase